MFSQEATHEPQQIPSYKNQPAGNRTTLCTQYGSITWDQSDTW